MAEPTRNIGMPQVTVTASAPCRAYAGFATAITVDGIECIVITKTKADVIPLMDAIGFLPGIHQDSIKPVAVLSRGDVEVLP